MQIVNGFVCKTCCDVDLAKKHIDPAHPKDGPYGVNAPDSRKIDPATGASRSQSVRFGGALAGLNGDQPPGVPPSHAQGQDGSSPQASDVQASPGRAAFGSTFNLTA